METEEPAAEEINETVTHEDVTGHDLRELVMTRKTRTGMVRKTEEPAIQAEDQEGWESLRQPV